MWSAYDICRILLILTLYEVQGSGCEHLCQIETDMYIRVCKALVKPTRPICKLYDFFWPKICSIFRKYLNKQRTFAHWESSSPQTVQVCFELQCVKKTQMFKTSQRFTDIDSNPNECIKWSTMTLSFSPWWPTLATPHWMGVLRAADWTWHLWRLLDSQWGEFWNSFMVLRFPQK